MQNNYSASCFPFFFHSVIFYLYSHLFFIPYEYNFFPFDDMSAKLFPLCLTQVVNGLECFHGIVVLSASIGKMLPIKHRKKKNKEQNFPVLQLDGASLF